MHLYFFIPLIAKSCQPHFQNKSHIYPHLSPHPFYQPNPSYDLIYYKSLLTHLLPPVFSLIYSSQNRQRNLLESTLDYIKTPD